MPSFSPSICLCLFPVLSYHCETYELNMATEISNRRSIFIFILFFSVTVFLNSCGLLFADSCDSHELDPESFSWESRMLCWLGLLVFWALVNVALGVSFHFTSSRLGKQQTLWMHQECAREAIFTVPRKDSHPGPVKNCWLRGSASSGQGLNCRAS